LGLIHTAIDDGRPVYKEWLPCPATAQSSLAISGREHEAHDSDCAAAMLVAATPVNAQRANPEGQSWDSDYTAREWLKDCTNRANKCRFFILTVAQASYWCEKCIPSMTSLTEVEEVMRAFIAQNPQYVDGAATNVLLTAIHSRWPCKSR